MNNFSVYLEVSIRTNKSQIISGFATAASFLVPGSLAQKFVRAMGTRFASHAFTGMGEEARDLGERMKRRLQEDILNRPGTGAIYSTQWRTIGGRPVPIAKLPLEAPHQASAPGEPPAPFKGDLRDSIDYTIEKTGTDVIVCIGTPLDHGLYQELGMAWVEPRPWLRLLRNEMLGNVRVVNGRSHTEATARGIGSRASRFFRRFFGG